MNRPYSLINIFDNLRGSIKKKPLEKLLDQLEAEGQIMSKSYGKAKIYFYNQSLHPQLDPEAMTEVKNRLDKHKEENKEKTLTVKELKSEISRLEKVQTIEGLNKELNDLKGKETDIEAQIAKYKSNEVKLVSDAEIKVAEAQRDKVLLAMKKRDKMLKEIIDMVSESIDQKANKVRVLMGLD